MTVFALLLTYGAAALGFFLLIDGVGYLIANTGDRGLSRTRRRLKPEASTGDQESAISFEKEDANRPRSTIGGYVAGVIKRAHVDLLPFLFYLIVCGISGLFYVIISLVMPFIPTFIHLFIALVVGIAVPIIYLKGLEAKRMRLFQEQFPDALDLIVRSLKIGHPIGTALATIAEELPDPLATEFNTAAQQVTYGKSPPEAIGELAERVPLQDVKFFSVAVQIHHGTGGNLAEILDRLSDVIRGRFHLFRKVKALTVEGRFSGWFLSLFPVILIFGMSALQPGYYDKVSDLAYFPHLVALTFFLLLVNVVAMRAMTKLEV